MPDPTQNNALPVSITPSLSEIDASQNPLSFRQPPPIIPIIPNGAPVNSGAKELLQGNFHTGPDPAKKVAKTNGTMDYVNAAAAKFTDPNVIKDEFKYGRAYSYGAGHKDANFERYYNHPKFKELGFSPYRDNDAHYNERSSWWDDFSRMRGQWGGLAAGGFKSIWRSEEAANATMEKGMSIGSSTKEGFGAKVTNFGLNSAYTVGIMGEIALEDLGLAAIEIGTFGTASAGVGAAAIARNSMSFGRLYKGWKATSAMLKELKSVDKAKDFWSMANAADKTKDFAQFLNPLARTMEFGKDIMSGTGSINSLSKMAKVTKGFGNFYKDMRELNVAHSEAALEGEGSAVAYQQKLTDEYYAEHGKMAEGDDAREIYKRAQSIKATVTLANDATIYYSNKLVFEDLFEGFGGGRKLAKAALEGSGRTVARVAPKGYKVGENIVSAGTRSGMQKVGDALLRSNYVPWSKKYFVGNLGEALQENAQEMIQVAAVDYYDKVHKDPTQVGFYSTLASIGKGTEEQFSAKGFETFLSGYLMGSLIQGGSGAFMKGANMISSKGKTKAEQAERADNDKLDAANYIGKNALLYTNTAADTASAMTVANKARKDAEANGDEKTARDMQNEMHAHYFNKLASTNSMGLVTDHVDDMLTLNDKDLTEAYGLTEDQAQNTRKKLSGLKAKAEAFQGGYDLVNKKYPNPYNPWIFDQKKHPKEFQKEYDKYDAHNKVVGDLLYAKDAYSDVAERMTSLHRDLSNAQGLINFNTLNKSKAADISILIDPLQRSTHQASLRDQINILKSGTATQQKEAKRLEEQSVLLKQWNIDADDYVRTSFTEGATVDALEKNQQRLYDTYEKYVKHVAKDEHGHTFKDDLEQVFAKVKDFQLLNTDSQKMVNTINTLSDPKYFQRYADIQESIAAIKNERRAENLKQALNTFKERADKNEFLGKLFDLGVYVLPEDIDKLVDFTVVDFYNQATNAMIDPVADKELYTKILDIIEQYGEKAGADVTEKPIPEAKGESIYNTRSRPKYKNTVGGLGIKDDRKYADYAKQFGFDFKSSSSKVSTAKVLKAIVASRFTSRMEKSLARRLLTTVKPNAVITFVNDLSTPGLYKADTQQTIVDARYSSSDYSGGVTGHPFEYVILHEYLHSLTVDGLKTDAVFNSAIDNLHALATAFMQSPQGKNAYGDKPMYGLKNTAEFIAEAMTNPMFQEMLSDIPFTSTTGRLSSAWEEFNNAVKNFLKRLLGGVPNTTSSVLDEAFIIITAKLDGPATKDPPKSAGVAAPKGPTTLGKNDLVTNVVPIPVMMAEVPKLVEALVETYRIKLTKDLEEDGIADFPYDTAADIIVASDKFKDFVMTNSTANSVIANFNADPVNGRSGKQPVLTGQKKTIPPNEWAPGNKKLLTGKTMIGDLVDIPVEVIEDEGVIEEDGFKSHYIAVKNMNTGEIFDIDKLSDEFKLYTFKPLPVQQVPAQGNVPGKPVDTERLYKGISVVEDPNITNSGGHPGAAQYDRNANVIRINPKLLREKYDLKAWTKAREQSDKSFSTPLPENTFSSYEEFKTFCMEHEFQHSVISKGSFDAASKTGDTTYGEYEDEINRRALHKPVSEEVQVKPLFEAYDNITDGKTLHEWKNQAIDLLSSLSFKDQMSDQGIVYDGKFVRDKIAEKELELAKNLNFEDLVKDAIVVTNDNKRLVVRENTGDEIMLVTYKEASTNDPTAKPVVVHRNDVKTKIKYMHSEFVHRLTKGAVSTEEDKQLSDQALAAVNADKDAAKRDALMDQAKNESHETIQNKSANLFKNCKVL